MDSNRKRNAVAVVGVYIFALALWLLAPPQYGKEAQLTCGGMVATPAKFNEWYAPLLIRLLLLNAAVAAVVITQFIVDLVENAAVALYALLAFPIVLPCFGY